MEHGASGTMNLEKERKMRILVIDDEICNQESARETLAEHELTICGTVEETSKALGFTKYGPDKNLLPFDAVLTDLWMPMPKPNWDRKKFLGHIFYGDLHGDYGDKYGEMDERPAPVGLIFALRAVNMATPLIAILTDGDHHTDRMVTLLDIISGNYDFGIVNKFEAREYNYDGAKNWGKLLKEIERRSLGQTKKKQ